jgi:hypothetical protein
LGFQIRNDTEILSPDGVLSPELEGWPIYSTSFLLFVINGLAKWPAREVRNLFARQPAAHHKVKHSPRPQAAIANAANDDPPRYHDRRLMMVRRTAGGSATRCNSDRRFHIEDRRFGHT